MKFRNVLFEHCWGWCGVLPRPFSKPPIDIFSMNCRFEKRDTRRFSSFHVAWRHEARLTSRSLDVSDWRPQAGGGRGTPVRGRSRRFTKAKGAGPQGAGGWNDRERGRPVGGWGVGSWAGPERWFHGPAELQLVAARGRILAPRFFSCFQKEAGAALSDLVVFKSFESSSNRRLSRRAQSWRLGGFFFSIASPTRCVSISIRAIFFFFFEVHWKLCVLIIPPPPPPTHTRMCFCVCGYVDWNFFFHGCVN